MTGRGRGNGRGSSRGNFPTASSYISSRKHGSSSSAAMPSASSPTISVKQEHEMGHQVGTPMDDNDLRKRRSGNGNGGDKSRRESKRICPEFARARRIQMDNVKRLERLERTVGELQETVLPGRAATGIDDDYGTRVKRTLSSYGTVPGRGAPSSPSGVGSRKGARISRGQPSSSSGGSAGRGRGSEYKGLKKEDSKRPHWFGEPF